MDFRFQTVRGARAVMSLRYHLMRTKIAYCVYLFTVIIAVTIQFETIDCSIHILRAGLLFHQCRHFARASVEPICRRFAPRRSFILFPKDLWSNQS